MTKNKDFKRLARERMRKTGESYTTARARLLDKTPSQSSPPTLPEDYLELAGMSDEAVESKTGRDWKSWVEVLDEAGATSLSHREIARLVHQNWGVSGWWAQTVTVGYERIRGLREVGQRRDGSFDANKSRTFPVPVERLYDAFADKALRATWLPGVDLVLRKATPAKSLRVTWEDGTPLDIYFNAKDAAKSPAAKSPAAKSQVSLQHRLQPTREGVEELKQFWAEHLDKLGEVLSS